MTLIRNSPLLENKNQKNVQLTFDQEHFLFNALKSRETISSIKEKMNIHSNDKLFQSSLLCKKIADVKSGYSSFLINKLKAHSIVYVWQLVYLKQLSDNKIINSIQKRKIKSFLKENGLGLMKESFHWTVTQMLHRNSFERADVGKNLPKPKRKNKKTSKRLPRKRTLYQGSSKDFSIVNERLKNLLKPAM